MAGGFIKLYRQLTSWEWYQDANTKSLFLHLLLMANHAPGKWKGIEVGRGQHITSTKKLAKETGLTIKEVRTALLHLEKTGEISKKGASRWTLLTVENYGFYQGEEPEKGKQRASKGQAKGKQRATNKKEKKEEKKENDSSRETRERRKITFADGTSRIYSGGTQIWTEEEARELLKSDHEEFIKAMKERKAAG